jgi:hypothetical protein
MEQNGWRFYDPRLFRDAPNNSNLPWKTIWEEDGAKVRWADTWLMYRSSDYDARLRRAALAKKNGEHDAKFHPGEHRANLPGTGEEYNYVVNATEGREIAGKLLREKKFDDLDKAWSRE